MGTARWMWLAALTLSLVIGSARFGWGQDAADDATVSGDEAIPLRDTPGYWPPAEGFTFGSYGRVVAAGDLEGGHGKAVRVVSYAPRLIENPYLELDFSYAQRLDDADFRTVVTLAISDALLHFDGDFDGVFALRNAFVEATLTQERRLTVWVGSRMYRGDDIYLLDFWPLDELNTVGAGATYRMGPDGNSRLALQLGFNQLQDGFQYQEITVAGPSFETEQQIFQDRIRLITSLRYEQLLPGLLGAGNAKFVVFAAYQSLGEGQFEDDLDVVTALPSDLGYTLGAQLGAWVDDTPVFANLFFRYSRGLAAYGELAIPSGLANDRTATDATLTRLGLSLNWENDALGVTGGGYIQWFRDADDITFDPDDYYELAFALRPVVFFTEHFHTAVELSYQRRRPDGLNARTDTFLEPAVWQFALMPLLATESSAFARPQIRAIYAVSLVNDGARALFPEDDPRGLRETQHYLGLSAEWWFNSSTY